MGFWPIFFDLYTSYCRLNIGLPVDNTLQDTFKGRKKSKPSGLKALLIPHHHLLLLLQYDRASWSWLCPNYDLATVKWSRKDTYCFDLRRDTLTTCSSPLHSPPAHTHHLQFSTTLATCSFSTTLAAQKLVTMHIVINRSSHSRYNRELLGCSQIRKGISNPIIDNHITPPQLECLLKGVKQTGSRHCPPIGNY